MTRSVLATLEDVAASVDSAVTTERSRAVDAETSGSEALTAHESANPAHSASHVSVNPSGLVAVTGTDVQAALAELDAAVGGASEQAVTFPVLPSSSNDPFTVTGQVLIVTGTGFLTDTPGIVFSGADQNVGNIQAQGTIDADGNFTDGLVVVDYGGEGALSYSVIGGTATQVISGIASLTGDGLFQNPGDLIQNGGFTVEDGAGDGISLSSEGQVDILSVLNGAGGPLNVRAGTSLYLQAGAVDGTSSLDIAAAQIYIADVPVGQAVGFFGTTPVYEQGAAIPPPNGGAVVDAEARAAIVAILNILGAATNGLGITA